MQHQQSTLETPVVFDCQDNQLLGIIHRTDSEASLGVLLVVGGPQYRAGSHRQFVLLARYLAGRGIPAMRFDVRGMGDSNGDGKHFDELDADIQSAVDCFITSANLKRVIIWGLCDAASAALFYAYQDHRVAGLVLLNPWVFTEQGSAKTYLKHYYIKRIASPDFWKKVFSFKFDVVTSFNSLFVMLKKSRSIAAPPGVVEGASIVDKDLPLPVKMRECFRQFGKPVLLILSGRDLTADEFKHAVANDPDWQKLLSNPLVTKHDFLEADHTFSSAVWRDQVAEWTASWVTTL
jgi:uncharacterized protein